MQDYTGLPQSFSFFTLSDLMDKKIPADALKNKIVLIGGTALSLNDYRLLPNKTKCFGVEHHAYFISQLLNSAIKVIIQTKRSLPLILRPSVKCNQIKHFTHPGANSISVVFFKF